MVSSAGPDLRWPEQKDRYVRRLGGGGLYSSARRPLRFCRLHDLYYLKPRPLGFLTLQRVVIIPPSTTMSAESPYSRRASDQVECTRVLQPAASLRLCAVGLLTLPPTSTSAPRTVPLAQLDLENHALDR